MHDTETPTIASMSFSNRLVGPRFRRPNCLILTEPGITVVEQRQNHFNEGLWLGFVVRHKGSRRGDKPAGRFVTQRGKLVMVRMYHLQQRLGEASKPHEPMHDAVKADILASTRPRRLHDKS